MARQHGYWVYQTSVLSDLEMSGLPGCEQAGADIRFTMEGVRAEPLSEHQWYHQYWRCSNGEPWLSCARQAEGYLLREHGVGDFFSFC